MHYVYNDDIITCTAPRDIAVNEFVVMGGSLAGFAKSNVKAGDKFALVRKGVFEVEVDAAADVTAGQAVFFEAGALTTAAGDVQAGFAGGDVYPAAAGKATIHLILA